MKKNLFIIANFLFFGCFSVILYAQTDCNQNIWNKRFAKNLPKEVCIPKGYIISYVYDDVDLNNDGLKDFIFKWRKTELLNGDTLFVTIYKQNPDKSFSPLKTIKNLYPIFFQRYDYDYIIQDSSMNELKGRYNGFYPFHELHFETNTIILKIETETGTGYSFYWKYNDKKKNWFMDNIIKWDNILPKYDGQSLDNIDTSQSIDEFSYFDYL